MKKNSNALSKLGLLNSSSNLGRIFSPNLILLDSNTQSSFQPKSQEESSQNYNPFSNLKNQLKLRQESNTKMAMIDEKTEMENERLSRIEKNK